MLNLIRRKACKRCGGDLSVECDIYGVYIECIQCGATYTKEDLRIASQQQTIAAVKTEAVKPLADAVPVQR